MMKNLGLCIVLFTIYYVCKRVIGAKHKREELISELSELVAFLKDGIALYVRPLPELYSAFEWRYLADYGFPDVLANKRQGVRYTELWQAVGDEVAEILSPLFDGLGEHSYAEELALLDRACERMSAALDAERAHASRTGKLAVTLGLSLSLAITILVI